MKIEYLLSIFIFIGINSLENDSIIAIPKSKGSYYNITTKYGFINYSHYFTGVEVVKWPLPITIYILEGIKNLNLINLTEIKNKNGYFIYKEIYGENKDSIKLEIRGVWKDFNKMICKILYKTKYINKMIYSIGIFNNKKYKYFGGTPENFRKAKDLKKFTFSKDDYASKIIIRSPENSFSGNYGNEIIDTSNKEGRFLRIIDYDDMIVCIPQKIFNMYTTSIYEAGDLLRHNSYYKLDKRQQKFFGSITFMIGNKSITINRDPYRRNR